MTDTPIGIPSGWEEIAAFEAINPFPNYNAFHYRRNETSADDFSRYTHDWRVLE